MMTQGRSVGFRPWGRPAGKHSIGIWVAIVMTIVLQGTPTLTMTIPGSQGKEFVFAFPPNYAQDGVSDNIGVIIQPVTGSETSVDVSVPLRGFDFNVTLPAGSGQYHLDLPPDLVGWKISGLSHSTIVVRTDHDISLVAYNYKDYTMDTFTVLPTNHLGNEYFVAVYTQPGTGTIIISGFSEPSLVEMKLTSEVEYLAVNYGRGDIITQELQPYESIQLEPSFIDIVGTRIIANTSIAVVVGCMCAYIPSNQQRCDHLVEQLIPYSRWGRSFTLSPFIGRNSGYQFQVVAGRNATEVSINEYLIDLDMGEHHLEDVNNQRMTSVIADKPVMIMQYTKGTDTDGMPGDPSMLLVPPHEQYLSHIEFSVYEFPATLGIGTMYIAVTAECNKTDGVVYNTSSSDQAEVTWMAESFIDTPADLRMCTRWLDVQSGTHTLTSTSSAGSEVVFTSFVYGVGRRISYLHNSGFNLDQLTCTTLNTTTSDSVEVTCESFKPRICPAEESNTSHGIIYWPETEPNTEVSADILCSFDTLKDGVPIATRMCIQNLDEGVMWLSVSEVDCGIRTERLQPGDLAQVIVNEANVETVSGVLEEVTGAMDEIDEEAITAISVTLEHIVMVASPAVEVTTSVVKAVNNIAESLSSSNSSNEEVAAASSSVVLSLEQQISLTLQDRGHFSLSVSNMIVDARSLDKVASSDGLEFGGYDVGGTTSNGPIINIPSSALMQSSNANSSTMMNSGVKVRFITFKGNSLFRSADDSRTSGNVLSAAIEGTTLQDLAEPVEIRFHAEQLIGENDTITNQSKCVFWDFKMRSGIGDWSSDGCSLGSVSEGEITCSCNHLTNFAVLVDIAGQQHEVKTKYHFVLDILSQVGCAISIIALVITLGVFFVFRRLRASRPRRILLHFCVSLLCLYIVFVGGIDNATGSNVSCAVVGALLHYFILTTMTWMAVEALNMYLLIVRVFDEEGPWFVLKSAIFAWGTPLVVVGITVGVKTEDYANKSYCFLTPSMTFFLTVLLPVGIILLFNFVMFIVVLCRLWKANLRGNAPLEKSDKSARYKQLRTRLLNAFSISVLLGLTWVFGFLAVEDATFVFQLIFCLANSLQGLVVFILFCVRQEDVRKTMRPYYRCFTGMLPLSKPSAITAYSLNSSKMTSRNDHDDNVRNPLRTTPISGGTYTSKLSTTATITSTNNDFDDCGT